MKKLLKIFSLVFCVMIVMSVIAFAASTSAYVDITTSQSVARSSRIIAKSVKYSGENHAISSRRLYILPRYVNDAGNYVTGDSQQALIAIGGTCTNFVADVTFTSEKFWIMELNPYGAALRGCSGWGTVTKLT